MSTKKSFLFISCDEAKQICDKSQYGEATVWEKVKLNIRLSWCKITRAYSRRNAKLTQLVNKAHLDSLEPECKDRMRKKLQEELSK
ncbi:hypothetical protein ACFQ1M_10985 [Sungkyunkwania multivorans]|uniref:Uncharacterized protein n=1 Tax=Sungkyunkwania multivorans TaxID=1173618 RepID=A0ABW3D0T0_9FLAO